MSSCVLELENIVKKYKQGSNEINILSNVNLQIQQQEVVGLIGPSGCGKSTLLQIAGLLDSPISGKVIIDGEDCSKFSDKEKTLTRLNKVGFIYQFHHLLNEFSAIENVAIPLLIANKDQSKSYERAKELLSELGLKNRINHRPYELSGGEQQRVAIARALINSPKLILADEPTGNLDPVTSQKVFDILLDSAKNLNLAVLLVTHNHEIIKKFSKVIEFSSL